ncbi:L-histidine N(alpha)-methyltransferase [Synechococcus sp. PROS-U-1]|uniref:L-histidine N(alpha)-methyltransferase n=1 Tax=Synechococcus sp. PROS-U-1 TaxID=1400866 RepID=UPI0016485390|nr:L-histidine N(alpha)-methyltransferase [Synechococcus sp. PROS-U-1]QNJ01840.1 dimethylhistidine N-methyltransferase [Synechococcus sp. PROS-U-1]
MSITLLNLHPPQADLQRLVRDGLRRKPRQLPAWMLYDAEGSRLFAEICRQPEYTLTNREITLLKQHAEAIADATGAGLVVEFGIGNARKVDPLLTALGSSVFAALDISLSALEEALSGLAAQHPNTAMVGVCCDHTRLQQLPRHPALDGERRIGFFPGSSLGNFTPEEAVDFLRNARQLLAGGPLLLGVDQPREPALMEAAYDDAAGVSAAFARNLLQRLNRDLQGDADPTQFRYQASWQPQDQRIEMALISRRDQTVHLGGEAWFFRNGEAWITEHSVKYSQDAAAALVARAGWRIERSWEDPHQQMALHLLLPAD